LAPGHAPAEASVVMKHWPHPQGRAVSPFTLLDADHQGRAVLRLADSRMADYGIASVTGLDVCQVRRIIAARATEIRARDEVSP
jgi:hypothetical protein